VTTATLEKPATQAPAAIDYAILASGVTKTYGSNGQSVRALRGVGISVARGEMVAIMGPSGCGKTTLLNCLSGLDDVDTGEVFIDGIDIARMPDKARTSYRAQNMGFIFQTYNLLPVLSAVENVELPLVVSGVRPSAARARALDSLERVGLRDRAQARPSQLSGGQRQRVTVARALVNNPAIVWADEPTGALDSRTSNDVMTLMEDLNRSQGLTFVIVTHDQRVGSRCHRTIQMQDGLVVTEGAGQ
jgi:putative ABC transport system ATP-binding protein